MRTDQPAYQMFDPTERAFLERMFLGHPDIAERFDEFLALPPQERFDRAHDILQALPREGWKRREVKDPESVWDHLIELGHLVRQVELPRDLCGLTRTEARQRLVAMALNHDIPEAIVKDFTPHCPIAPEDKEQLERLAGRVIFESNPAARGMIEEYCAQRTPLSHLLHDFDKLVAVQKALQYEGIYPEKRGKLYEEFRGYAVARLKTDQGRNYAGRLERGADEIRRAARKEFMEQRTGRER